MKEISTKQKNITLKKLKTIGITNEKDIANIKVSELKKINENENLFNLTIKDIELIWAIQDAIKGNNLLGFFTDSN